MSSWKAPKQEACEPGCTCGLPTEAPLQLTARDPGPLRECGVTGCVHCREITRFWESDPDPVPGGGDRLPNSSYTKGTR